eukprot:scaffold365021_cov28-Attheya_sp.AAC.1
MLLALGFGAAFKLAVSGGTFQLVGYAFVDDSDIIQTAATLDEPIEEVLANHKKESTVLSAE